MDFKTESKKKDDLCSFIHMCLCQSVVALVKPKNSKLSKIQFDTKIVVIIILEMNTAFTLQKCTKTFREMANRSPYQSAPQTDLGLYYMLTLIGHNT